MAAPEVVSIGALLVEIMRQEVDSPLDKPADFVGPFPIGAPAIFYLCRPGCPAGT